MGSSPSWDKDHGKALEVSSALPRIGQRVVLRRLSTADLAHFQAYRQDEQVGRYQGWTSEPDHQALMFLDEMSSASLFAPGKWIQLGIADRGTNALIGDIGICVAAAEEKAEIGFTLRAQSQGDGLGTEAITEAIGLLFEHTAVLQAVGITDARNIPSVRLLERAGMRRVVTVNSVFRGEPCVEHVYVFSRHDGGQASLDSI